MQRKILNQEKEKRDFNPPSPGVEPSKSRLWVWHATTLPESVTSELPNYSKSPLIYRGLCINLPAFYHECCSLIGFATHYLFCCRSIVAIVNKMATAPVLRVCQWSIFSGSEGDLSNFVVQLNPPPPPHLLIHLFRHFYPTFTYQLHFYRFIHHNKCSLFGVDNNFSYSQLLLNWHLWCWTLHAVFSHFTIYIYIYIFFYYYFFFIYLFF